MASKREKIALTVVVSLLIGAVGFIAALTKPDQPAQPLDIEQLTRVTVRMTPSDAVITYTRSDSQTVNVMYIRKPDVKFTDPSKHMIHVERTYHWLRGTTNISASVYISRENFKLE